MRLEPKYKYMTTGGKRVPSVTTVIGRFADKNNLIGWAFKTGYEQAQENERRAKEGSPRLHYDLYRKGDADIGTVAHKLIEGHICKRDPDFSDLTYITTDRLDYLKEQAKPCFEAYLRWQQMTKVDFEYLEHPLTSDKHEFGGCFDGVGIAGGSRALLDFKSSKKVWWDYHIQLAAYSILWHEHYPHLPLEGGYHILRFSKNGDFEHRHLPELREEAKYFLRLRELYEHEKLVKGR